MVNADRLRSSFDVLLLALLAATTNFLYLYLSNGDYFFPDSATYLGPARNLLHGLGYVLEPGFPETMRTPGYPVFLLPFLAITKSMLPIVIVQHLMNVGLTIAIYMMVLRLGLHRRVAFVAAAIWAVDVPSIHHANKVLTETLFTVLLFVLFALATRIVSHPRFPLAAVTVGLLSGVLVLVRPVAILYFVVLAIVLAPKLRARGTAVLLIAGALLPFAWCLRNRAETGVFTISTIGGGNMLEYRAAGALAMLDDYDFDDALADRQGELTDLADKEIVRGEHAEDAEDVSPTLRSRYYNEVGRRIALQHPRGLLLVTARGLLVNLFDSNWGAIEIVSRLPSLTIERVLTAWTMLVFVLACFGMVSLFRTHRYFAVLLVATVLYFLLISAGGESEARFRVPVMPMIAIAAAAGLQRMELR
ncbi:MAG: hypothetical protein ACXVJT_00630 [Thermoanaerobaculia bacterium]